MDMVEASMQMSRDVLMSCLSLILNYVFNVFAFSHKIHLYLKRISILSLEPPSSR